MFNLKIMKIINDYIGKSKYKNISIGIIIDNKKYKYCFNKSGISNETFEYQIGSVSKTFTAHLILKYALEKLYNLDSNAGELLGLNGSYPTIDELLTHRAGYGHFTPIEITMKSLLFHSYCKKNPYEKIKKYDVIKCFKRRKKRKKYYYSYSDFNFAVLAVILETIKKDSFINLMNNFLKNDLNLHNTYVPIKEKLNLYCVKNNKLIFPWRWNGNNPYLAAGGIISNIDDMINYMKIQMNSKEEYINKCHEISDCLKKRKDEILIARGWHAYKSGNHLWHVGGISTHRSSIIISKSRKIGVVVLGNSGGKNKANVHYIAKMIYSYLVRNKKNLNNE